MNVAEPPAWPEPTATELAALDDLGREGIWELQGRELHLTNLDKVLFPGAGRGEAPLTKRELVRYAACIGPWVLPYLWDRPLNLHRFPDGVTEDGFWQRAMPHHAPAWFTRWRYGDAGPGDAEHLAVANTVPSLVWLANYGALEWHPWTSAASNPHEPTWALVDVDPGPKTTWDELLALVGYYRTALEHLGLEAGPKVTGKRGIQVWIPIGGGCGFADTRAWVEELSRAIGATVPELVSWKWEKAERKGRARLDYTQNAINKTLVAPFSPRPAAGAPVSVPIAWDELDDADLRSDRWNVRTVLARLAESGDPLRRLVGLRQTLPSLC